MTVVGTGVSTTIDSGGTFTLNNVPAGTVQLHFQGRGADAMLTISGIAADDRLQIAVTLNGRDARLDSSSGLSGGRGVDVNGRIDSINAAARTLQVAGSTVRVQPSTIIRHGSRTFAFADLRVGDHVIVKGSRSGVNVTATEIKVNRGDDDDDGEDDDGDDDNESEVRGTVSLLTGTCPGLTFTVAGTRVVTNAATRFEEGTCSTLRNEMRVEVEGIRRNDGSLLATEVERESLTVSSGRRRHAAAHLRGGAPAHYNQRLSLFGGASQRAPGTRGGPVAQLAEQQTLNLRVGGSIPPRLTRTSGKPRIGRSDLGG